MEKGKLKYVLLVGADTTDPYNHLGAGSVSYVPTAYLPYVQYVSFSPTDEVLVDADDDGVGEVPIGRLPVRTPAELAAVVAKLKAWEAKRSPRPAAPRCSPPGVGSRHLARRDQPLLLHLARHLERGYCDAGGDSNRRRCAAVLAAMNAGTPLVSFVGHSSMGQWDFTPILKWQDVAGSPTPASRTSYRSGGAGTATTSSRRSSRSRRRMLLTPDVGVAAAIGATTLTTEPRTAAREPLLRPVNAGAATVGEAFHGAKQELRAQAARTTRSSA